MNLVNPRTIIVLATYNGAEFLAEQLDSLVAQTESDWNLLVRDDGSTDGTLEILQEFAGKDGRIQILDNESRLLGSALDNFSILLLEAYEQGAEYVFCCDQDDIWGLEKLGIMLSRLMQLEGKGDAPAPSLVHHDLAVVSKTLEPVADSFFEYMQLVPSDQNNPQRLISRNEVTGCAMACNRSLLEIALPISKHAVMHDWWLALCAGYFGLLEPLPLKLVKYRQHGANTIGAKSFWHGLNPRTNWIEGWRRGDSEFIQTINQARAFLTAMDGRLDKNAEDYQSLVLYGGLLTKTRGERLKMLSKFGLWRTHWFLNLMLVLRMLLLPRVSVE